MFLLCAHDDLLCLKDNADIDIIFSFTQHNLTNPTFVLNSTSLILFFYNEQRAIVFERQNLYLPPLNLKSPFGADHSKSIFYEDRFKQHSSLLTFNNASKRLEQHKFTSHGFEVLNSYPCTFVTDRIDVIDVQDSFVFLISVSGSIHILTPLFNQFGRRDMNVVPRHPKLIGTKMFFLDEKECFRSYDLVTRTLKDVFESCTFFSYVDQKYFVLQNNELKSLCCSDMISLEFSILWFVSLHGYDIRDSSSSYNFSYVQTFFPFEMDPNLENIMMNLCKVAKTIYSRDDLKRGIVHKPQASYPFLRDPYTTCYYGNDVNSISTIKESFFHKHTNYQDILCDMVSIYFKSAKNNSMKEVETLIEQYGLDFNPNYILSGRMHLTWPMRGKGWHHNIENVPNHHVDVLYFVTTDQNSYGGSFFFYRHPHSCLIHAVPDIHATMKSFKLVSNKESPLWHAIGSYSAHRISWGLSRRAHMIENAGGFENALFARDDVSWLHKSFIYQGYVKLENFLCKQTCLDIVEQIFSLHQQGKTMRDVPCPISDSVYGDTYFEHILFTMLPIISNVTKIDLVPQYSYARIYRSGETLRLHTDRPECEVSVTICAGYNYSTQWPIYFETSSGTHEVTMEPGDAAIYMGCDIPHWRKTFQVTSDEWHVQLFLHYTNAHGPYKSLYLDRKKRAKEEEIQKQLAKHLKTTRI